MNKLRELLADSRLWKSLGIGVLVGVLSIILVRDIRAMKALMANASAGITQGITDSKNIDIIERSEQKQDARMAQAPQGEKPEILLLTDKNSVSLRGPIMPDTIGPIQSKLLKLSHELPKDATIYLVMNTPGGSVDAGLLLIDTAQSLPQKVATVNLFSASMGFHIAEHLDERLALPHSTLMSHRMAAGIQGQVPGELITRLKAISRLADKEDAVVARRLGMSFEEYRKLIQDEYWVDGVDALQDKVVDRVVLARCDDSLDGEDKVDVQTLFGTFTLVYAQCPLITEPLRVEMPKAPTDEASNAKFVQFAEALSHDRRVFVRDYIITGKFSEYLK